MIIILLISLKITEAQNNSKYEELAKKNIASVGKNGNKNINKLFGKMFSAKDIPFDIKV